ncbi:hypothetical protein ACN91_21560 [Bacillus cereus]|uniref:SLATT domain-containing protein n=1 Tax=Bacillus cereus TaxID=1396 RepID=UPI0006AD5F0F|nr:SLATT domain-containing protein [Bacillus cereus]ALC54071.1 hypothetical protein ACN91_21560 [Bacillus cereus]MEB9439695.1 SLATT domain-containing protein [Bacillus cereus]
MNSVKVKSIRDEIKDFNYNRVWVEKKIRINAEERLNKGNFQTTILVNLYTFFMLCYSILGLKYTTSEVLSTVSVIISVGLFGVALYISLIGYREKALGFKLSHLELARIETKMSILVLDESKSDKELLELFEKYRNEYTEVLEKTDNHIRRDYLKYRFTNGKATKSEKLQYRLFYSFPSLVILFVLYSIPLAGLIIILLDVLG